MKFEDIKVKCADDKCCYHRDGVLLMSHPPQYRLICCHCGHWKYQQAWQLHKHDHGPFYRE